MSAYILPVLLILLVLFAAIKKVDVYNCFVDGGKESISLIVKVFPFISAVFILISLFKASGLSLIFIRLLEKPLSFLGIPAEVAELLLLRPLSGNGSLALLSDIFLEYGADSTVGRTAAVIMGSSETIFYIAAVYFSTVKIKKLRATIPIALIASLFGAIVSSWLCRLF